LRARPWTSRCGIAVIKRLRNAGIAMEIGIEPTARQGADLGYIPVVIKDACGFWSSGCSGAIRASLEFAGDALLTSAAELCAHLGRKPSSATA